MKRYMYKGTWSQELEDMVENSKSKPIVEEMFYKYGLTVYAKSSRSNGGIDSFLMTMDGLPYCEVYTEDVLNIKTGEPCPCYCYYSDFYQKDRGTDSEDKRTLRSTKLSKLIATIDKKQALMPDYTSLVSRYLMNEMASGVVSKINPSGAKKYIGDLKIPLVEKLLSYAISKTPLGGEELKEAKVILDKWTKVDDDERRTKQKVQAILGNEIYMIAETSTDGYAIGSIKITDLTTWREHELIKPFQRVLSLDDYEYIDEIRPALTMYKVYKESVDSQGTTISHKDYDLSYPRQEYHEDVGVITAYDNYPGGSPQYRPVWTIIPTVLE